MRDLSCFFLYLIYVELRREVYFTSNHNYNHPSSEPPPPPSTTVALTAPPSISTLPTSSLAVGGHTGKGQAGDGDRSHRLSYNGSFYNVLVSKTRAEGCLFLRKVNPSGRGSLFDARHEYQSSVGSSPSPSGWYASASSSLSPKQRGESVL